MKDGNDKSLKNEFEDNFEKRKLSDQPLHRDDVSGRGEAAPRRDADYRDERRDDTYRNELDETIPVIEEQAHVGKKVVESGKVVISKSLYDEEVTIDLPSMEEEVDVQRVEVNEYVDNMPPPIRYEGDTTIISVLKEVAVIEKRILLVEEIHIRKRKHTTHESQQIRLRKEEVDVKRRRPDAS